MRTELLALALVLLPTSTNPLRAQDDDEEDLRPTNGLIAQYQSGKHTIERIDPDVAFQWTTTPDPRLPSGPFQAKWQARLLVQQSEQYRFHAFVNGRVTMSVAGRTVLAGTGNNTWLDGDRAAVPFGDHPVDITFSSPKNGQGSLKLFWSSRAFPLEPIPAHLFSYENRRPELDLAAEAAEYFDAHRCARCHDHPNSLPTDPAPSLASIRGGLSPSTIVDKLSQPPPPGGDAKMPFFGISESQAEDVAAFLLSIARQPRLQKLPRSKDVRADKAAGRELVRTVGCLACHTLKDIGTTGPFSGGELASVQTRRSAQWVHTWLAQPAPLNAEHRMPVVGMSADERRQLALFLGGDKADVGVPPDERRIERGRGLVEKLQCANCHQIPGLQPVRNPAVSDWSCLKPTAGQLGPHYPQQSAGLAQAMLTHRQSLRSKGRIAGDRLLQRRNCLACHQRDSEPGILPVVGQLVATDADLRTRSQGLIPPALTAVGDKLKDDALAIAVSGTQKQIRLPWLSVRMPRFEHSPAERAALVSHFIEHDRIPPRADAPADPAPHSAQTLVAGQALIGSAGFSCIACHSAGRYSPRNVALGTRGSDLLMPAERLRKEYFLRWTRSPARIVPGMEMPSITKPVPGILDGDIDQQLAAAWSALNDKNFTVPTNPGSFEQFVVVEPGAAARVIRDVFTDPAGDGYIARPLVVGLNNGHNVLFDLDVFGLRHWWFGDVARQRTEGKSWYWDVAGIAVGSEQPGADVVIQSPGGAIIQPVLRRATHGVVQSWQQADAGIEFSYTLNFEIGKQRSQVQVVETIQPCTAGEDDGWQRSVRVQGVPDEHKPLLRVLKLSSDSSLDLDLRRLQLVENRSYLELVNGSGSIRYLSGLRRPPVKLAKQPELIAGPDRITSVPGFDGVRLPISRSIMPTSITRTANNTLVFTSLKGHVLLADDTDADGLPDTLRPFEEGLAAPFGVLRDGPDLLVAHKPEVIRLRDTDGDGRADERHVVSTGWGYSDNYHDWTCGLVRDSAGNVYFGLGSDYSQPKRDKARSLWRGAVLRLTPDGRTEPISWSFRYPVGFAIDSADRVFVTDNQGVQNTFNEINHIQTGRHYGVPSRHEPNPDQPETTPAIRVPHPWVRSLNAIVFLPHDHASPFGGHAVGCEYDTHLLVRLSFQTVGDTVQGAAYYLSKPGLEGGGSNFVGPICATVDDNGDIFVGSIHDSGWLGGRNTGAIERIRFNGKLPNGIREVRATPDGFTVELLRPVPAEKIVPANVSISGYTRAWQGSYATPDSARHTLKIAELHVADDGRTLQVKAAEPLRAEFVYEVSVGAMAADLFPATAHYTMKRVPGSK